MTSKRSAQDDRCHHIGRGQTLIIPRGARRAITAASGGFAYLTGHRRRARLWPAGLPRPATRGGGAGAGGQSRPQPAIRPPFLRSSLALAPSVGFGLGGALFAAVSWGSRPGVGWAMADHLRTELALEALAMALSARRPGAGLVHHTDRGGRYTTTAYQARLAARAIVCSMSRAGECLDNAVAERFFATLKAALVATHRWPTRAAAAFEQAVLLLRLSAA